MTERAPYVPSSYADPSSRWMPTSPDRDTAQEIATLRAELRGVRGYVRAAYLLAAGAFLFALISAVAASYTAWVVYNLLQALRDAANQING